MCVMLYLCGRMRQDGLSDDADELIGIPSGVGAGVREISWLNLGEEVFTKEQEHAVEAAAGYAAVGDDGVYSSLADGDAESPSKLQNHARLRARQLRVARCKLQLTAFTCKASTYLCCILLGPAQLALGIMCLESVGGDGAYCGAGSIKGSGASLVVFGSIFLCCLCGCACSHCCCCTLARAAGVDIVDGHELSGTLADLEAAQGVARTPCRACGYENTATLTHCVMCESLLDDRVDHARVPSGGGTRGAERLLPPSLARQQSWARTLNEGEDGALSIRFSRVDDDAAGAAAAAEGAEAESAERSSAPRRIGGGLVRSFASDGTTLEWHAAVDGYAVSVDGAAHGDVDAVQHQLEAMLRILPMKFGVKRKWFDAQMAQLRGSERGRIHVDRSDLLRSSMDQVLGMSAAAFGAPFKVNFDREAGIDMGGVTTDWVEHVIDDIFDSETGLFEQSQLDNIAYQLKPCSLSPAELLALGSAGGAAAAPPPLLHSMSSDGTIAISHPAVGTFSADEIEALHRFGEFAGLDVSSTDSAGFRTACYFCESAGFVVNRALDRYLAAQSDGDPASVVPHDYSPSASSGECSFTYRYISRESCSQFDSLPLTSLTKGRAFPRRLLQGVRCARA
jgi:hypothetical protein